MAVEHIDTTHAVSQVKSYLLALQNKICSHLEQADGRAVFNENQWQHRDNIGGGKTRTLKEGAIFEKAGVNFSHVMGQSLPPAATTKRPELADRSFQALGVSLVIHPDNPFIPTSHANVRFIIAEKKDTAPVWWFGGGFDLTPYYGFTEDCIHWHQVAKNASDPFGENVYHQHKKECDDYFYIKHRNEARGIGGLFYDDLNTWGFDTCFSHMQSIGNHFLDAYMPIVQRRQSTIFNSSHKKFQLYRRGRYVEFNLVYDRGTLFGLQTNGRTESILMSLPPQVEWHYDYQPVKGSEEEKLYTHFLPIKNWLG